MSVIEILRQLTNYLPNGGSGNFGLADKRELIGFVNTCAFIGSNEAISERRVADEFTGERIESGIPYPH